MKKIPVFQIDTFTDHLFKGNPAAVCPLDEWLPDSVMQQIAAENNLAETAFFVSVSESEFQIRWFTPTIEVDLCGHATLASAWVLFERLNYPLSELVFYTAKGLKLIVSQKNGMLFLDFPTDTLQPVDMKEEIKQIVGIKPLEVFKGKFDLMAVFASEDEIALYQPNLNAIQLLNARGLIITAPGGDVDFVSRFFAPQSGINEDPVTGSAHTSLIPYWSRQLSKTTLSARQLSQRRGELTCIYKGARCLIGGYAKLFLSGTIELPAECYNQQT